MSGFRTGGGGGLTAAQIVDLNSILTEVRKIDLSTGTGLLGISGSLSYEALESNRHVHHYSRAFGLAAAPAGETHRADEITSNPAPFVVDAGNNDWGDWLQLLGSSDTPVIAGVVKYDPHLISIVSAERANAIYLIQMAAGTSGAAGLAAGTYSDKVFTPQSAAGRPAAMPMSLRTQSVGTKLWIRTLVRGQDTGTLGIYVEIHEYEG